MPEIEGMLELAAPESIYVVITNEVVRDGRGTTRAVIGSNLREDLAWKMCEAFLRAMQDAKSKTIQQ